LSSPALSIAAQRLFSSTAVVTSGIIPGLGKHFSSFRGTSASAAMARFKEATAEHGGEGALLRRVGLARVLSKLGYCSRSHAGELIRSGRVRCNGAIKRDPEMPVRFGADRVEVDGLPVSAASRIYLMLNKPRGLVTSTADEKGRATIYSCLGKELPFLAPVGRLDKASEGLLLLTNDSEWAARVATPHSHLDKIYHVQISGVPDVPALLQSLVDGVRDGTGELLRAKNAQLLRGGKRNSWLKMILDEGKNRQIRRMLEHRKIQVLRLVRVAIGPVALGPLAKGDYRHLSRAEKSALDASMPAADSSRGPLPKIRRLSSG
jgi:23S rRNA pseudouridine2605 synthase